MTSSFIVSLKREKLMHQFCGCQNSHAALVCSLCRALFLQQWHLVVEDCFDHPETSVSLLVLTPGSLPNWLVVSSSLSSPLPSGLWVQSCCPGFRVSGLLANRAGQCLNAGSLTCRSLSCSCIKKWSAQHVNPHSLVGVIGWDC